MGLLDDRAVAERILDHIDRNTTDRGEEVWREPVANYRSPERLDQEIERVFRTLPSAFCPSAALPEVGSFVARDAARTPILAVRGAGRKVRAFRNACRHRGSQVASGSGRKNAFVCPYHGWAYGLDGALKNIPHEDGFPGVNKCDHGLVEVPASEHGGVVFVLQNPMPGSPFADLADMPKLLPGDLSLVSATEQETRANWKIAAEGFLEGYHIYATHRETFFPVQFDNLNVVERFGRNNRVTFPYRNIQKVRTVAPRDRRVEGTLTYVYHLFPNAIVATFPQRVVMVVLEPLDAGRTTFVNYTLAKGETLKTNVGAVERDTDFVNAGAKEDRAVVESIQRGLSSGANDVFTFGHFESAIVHFHRELHALLGEM
jgi:phenylpropionate dioxygenase-like ring-hydroxylating dioxygenase large terminal subunit